MARNDKKVASVGAPRKNATVPAFARNVTKAFTTSAKAAVQTHKARGEKVVGEVGGVWKSTK